MKNVEMVWWRRLIWMKNVDWAHAAVNDCTWPISDQYFPVIDVQGSSLFGRFLRLGLIQPDFR
jgi:hypothetical protein